MNLQGRCFRKLTNSVNSRCKLIHASIRWPRMCTSAVLRLHFVAPLCKQCSYFGTCRATISASSATKLTNFVLLRDRLANVINYRVVHKYTNNVCGLIHLLKIRKKFIISWKQFALIRDWFIQKDKDHLQRKTQYLVISDNYFAAIQDAKLCT